MVLGGFGDPVGELRSAVDGVLGLDPVDLSTPS